MSRRLPTGSIGRRIVAVAASALAVALLATPGPAEAHAGDESYVYLDVTDDDLRGRVELPYGDIRTVFGLDLEGTETEIEAELQANEERLHSYADQKLSIADESGREWPLTFDSVVTLAQAYDVSGVDYAIVPFVVELAGQDVPQVLTVTFDPFLDEIDGRNALLLIANDWKRGVFDNEGESLVQFDAGTRTRDVDLGESSQWTNFFQSVELGLDHIKSGPDHIFFVLVLLLPSVLVYTVARHWVPAPTFASSLWRVLKIVTMFTIAHSITFSLAGLGILPLPPSRLVESVIAVSIAAAALHNLFPVGANREWLIAFVFGLFHGMGFASLVSDLEVSRTTQLVSLLGRNVGIEIGQAAIVLMMFPGLFLLRGTRWYRPLFVGGSLVLAFVSLGWVIERVFDLEVGTSSLIDRVMQYPRVLLLVVAFTAAAAGIHWRARSRGELLEVAVHGHGDHWEDDSFEPEMQHH